MQQCLSATTSLTRGHLQDRMWFGGLIEQMVEKHFKGMKFNTVFECCESDARKITSEGLRRLTFGDWFRSHPPVRD